MTPVDGSPGALTGTSAEARTRLTQLAYTILCPSLGLRRRSLIAKVAVDRALSVPQQGDVAYADLRERVVRRTLATGRRRAATTTRLSARALRPARAAQPSLAWLLPAARAAYALQHLEGMDRAQTELLLAAAGVGDPQVAIELADRIRHDSVLSSA
ncbi:MAG: hypothetical protein ACT4P1_01835 [Sporichthyaceae bacterium]